MLIVLLGSFYILIGIIFLLTPLIIIELSRPRDLLKSGLILTIGVFLIIKQYTFNYFYSIIFILNTFLIGFFVIEIFTNRWNQLSQNEREKLKNFNEVSKNFKIFSDAVINSLKKVYSNLNIFSHKNKIPVTKKWVRSNDDAKISSSVKNASKSNTMKIKLTNSSEKDMIKSGKNLINKSKN